MQTFHHNKGKRECIYKKYVECVVYKEQAIPPPTCNNSL